MHVYDKLLHSLNKIKIFVHSKDCNAYIPFRGWTTTWDHKKKNEYRTTLSQCVYTRLNTPTEVSITYNLVEVQ